MKTNKWDIWWATVKFEDDPSKQKNRPVLVISETEMYILSFKITGHSAREDYAGEYEIRYWQEAGLTKPSTIRFEKRIRLKPEDVTAKIGELHPADRAAFQYIMTRILREL